ncbi:hypothetical protein [Paraburkholderia sp. MM5477-R1]|uniref:hypothetical protein n=1 Tax=Paraburkholderia sp. MM5477-R1 TaxID=2991062 RepID=UPI003D19D2CE
MGQLAATIAHEVNQPISATVANGYAAMQWLSAQPPDVKEVWQGFPPTSRAALFFSSRCRFIQIFHRDWTKREPLFWWLRRARRLRLTMALVINRSASDVRLRGDIGMTAAARIRAAADGRKGPMVMVDRRPTLFFDNDHARFAR